MNGDRDALPQYEVRRSARARRMRIRVTPSEGVVVILPECVATAAADRFVAAKRDWIVRAVARLEARHGPLAARLDPPLPERLELRALQRCLEVAYRHRAGRPVRAVSEGAGGCLHVDGDLADAGAVRQALQRFLGRTARAELVPWLGRLGRAAGLDFRRTRIGGQRTLWGSCSRYGTISLNYKLLFLPPPLVDYVLVHELAHTVHLDHSPGFWSVVAGQVPDCHRRHRELRSAGRYVPGWAELR